MKNNIRQAQRDALKKELQEELQEELNIERLLTMQEAMDYLSDRNIPCRSRNTFYRLLEDFDIPFININQNGANKVRRFKKAALDSFIESYPKA